MTDGFDLKHAPVGRKCDLAQLGQVVHATADTKVVGVIDGRLRPESSSFFMILLEVRVLEKLTMAVV